MNLLFSFKFPSKVVFSLCFIVGLSQISNAQSNPKISLDLVRAFEKKADQEFMIILKDQKIADIPKDEYLSKEQKSARVFTQLKAHAHISQKEILKKLEEFGVPSENISSHYLANVIHATGDHRLVERLANLSEVESIVLNASFANLQFHEELEDLSFEDSSYTWGLDAMHVPDVWELGYRGDGVIVGNQDTGIDWDNQGIIMNYRGYAMDSSSITHDHNWHDAITEALDSMVNPCGYGLDIPCDDNGHGTHTLGTSVGRIIDSIYYGVAPEAQWIACRNMDRGHGTPETYIDCFEWFLAPTDLNGNNPRPEWAPHVINNSWGCPESEGCNPENFRFMEVAIENLKQAGVVIVVSAGNDGRDGCGSIRNPAALYEQSFTVGAINNMDSLAGFSSIGPVIADSSFRLKPNVVAPGVGVYSIHLNNGFRTWNGTSMAGPHVVGLVALMISANPLLAGQVEEIENIIEATAIPISENGRDCFDYVSNESINHLYGFGKIDALAAVQRALEYDTLSLSHEEMTDQIEWEFFPNPSHNIIQFKNANTHFGSNLRIFDLWGKQVDVLLLEREVDISHLPKGLYIMTFDNSEDNHFFKLVKY